ncbi:MAG: flagellar basal body rod protein FlgC [Gammaproteobacteria bacterium]|nr:flagellar basal body rod protein FlgC [Gammaproteobacteria bacterium]
MNTFSAFEISAAGMNVERTRLDVSALNLANANSTRGPDGTLYKPMRVTATVSPQSFDAMLNGMMPNQGVVSQVQVTPIDTAPRMVFDPGHPDADERGFVAYPAVNSVTEMVQLISTTRAYEANVRALNAAKSMAMKALEIGSDR